MQDRIARIDETSCTARPDHTLGHSERLRTPLWLYSARKQTRGVASILRRARNSTFGRRERLPARRPFQPPPHCLLRLLAAANPSRPLPLQRGGDDGATRRARLHRHPGAPQCRPYRLAHDVPGAAGGVRWQDLDDAPTYGRALRPSAPPRNQTNGTGRLWANCGLMHRSEQPLLFSGNPRCSPRCSPCW